MLLKLQEKSHKILKKSHASVIKKRNFKQTNEKIFTFHHNPKSINHRREFLPHRMVVNQTCTSSHTYDFVEDTQQTFLPDPIHIYWCKVFSGSNTSCPTI